jgi:hypothetical protein
VGNNSYVAGQGDLNELNLGGPNSMLGFQGYGNEINSGGGNAIFGIGDYNTINSQGWDLLNVQGWNQINQPFDPYALQTALSPYFAEMSPNGSIDSETMIQLLLQQNRGRAV